MDYLTKTKELLLEPSFLTFASQVYEGFLKLDDDAWKQMISTYDDNTDLSVKTWLGKCKTDKPTRSIGGYMLTFKQYAEQEVQKQIRKDWERFNNEFGQLNQKTKEKAVGDFMCEVQEAKSLIPLNSFMEPIKKSVMETLISIESYYSHNSSSNNEPPTGNEHSNRSKLKWRGDASVLCALFLDLRDRSMKRKDDKYLLAGDDDLIRFIQDNFEFLDKDNEKVSLADDSIERYIKGDDMATRIGLDFSKLRR